MKPLIIIGAGGFGLEVAAYAQDVTRSGTEAFDLKGFWDDTKPQGATHADFKVLASCSAPVERDVFYIIAVGSPQGRRALAEKITAQGGQLATLVHPSAYVAASALVGEGCILAPFSFAGPESRIGRNVLLNLYASVAHESHVGDHSALAPYAGTHAGAKIGSDVFLAAHTVITHGITIGNGATVAAGAIVYNDVPSGVYALGNPARFKAA